LIHEHGLESYYAERARSDATQAAPAKMSARAYAELDDATFAATHVEVLPDGHRTTELFLEGIHCSACVWLIENLPRVAHGVTEARLDAARSVLRVVWDPSELPLSGVARALDRLGYPPHPAIADRERAETVRDRSLLMRIGVAGFAAGNVMLMAFALYSGAFSGMDAEFAALFRWGSFALALPSVGYCATLFYRGAFAALRTRTPHMDLPISVGISSGFAWGAVNTIRGSGEVYFDSITTLIFLLLVGRYLQQRHHRRAAGAAELALALAPTTARVLIGGGSQEVSAESVAVGSEVLVLAGERVPVDGRVERGSSSIDASLLTGESEPCDVRVGDRVYAGTINLTFDLVLVSECSGRETRVGKLVRSIENAQLTRAPIVKLADRVAGWFVVAVLGLALLTLLVWWGSGVDRAVDHAVALLVVTCPCALGMATPLSVSVALARAARAGLLLKGGEYLEALARPCTIVFDKTGTLTEGQPELIEFVGSDELLALAAAAEQRSEHPLAKALRRRVPGAGGAESYECLPGRGLRARVGGQTVTIGAPALFESLGMRVPEALTEAVERHARSGVTPVLVARGDSVEGLAAFGDALRADARQTLSELASLGYRLLVLSGDDPRVVERVCGDLPLVECRGGVSPEQKLERVRELAGSGSTVVMVGDGINDAAAMSAATVGFAVHGGAEASLLAAHAFSTRAGVTPVLDVVRGARQTFRVIERGIGFSLAYNALGVALAMLGVLSPLAAAILMPVSSLTVVSSALRSKAFRQET
jgi:Cu2+-exporting ATPase